MIGRQGDGSWGALGVWARLPARGLSGFRQLVWWCGAPCLVVPVLLAIAGVPAVWLLRAEGLLLTGVAAVVTWWTCAELAHVTAGNEPAQHDGAIAD